MVQTIFNLMIYLAGFGLMDIFMKKISENSRIIIYLILGIIGFYNYIRYNNNGERKEKEN